MSTELRRLAKLSGIARDKAIKLISGGTSLHCKLEVEPEDFLEQAEQDYDLGGRAALLNALTNAKRAIHCQFDKVLLCLGFDPFDLKLKSKLDLLTDLGFLTPRILKKVTDARNLLEHRYQAPTMPQIEEAIDLASMFIEATNRSLDLFEGDFTLGNEGEQIDGFTFSRELAFGFMGSDKGFRVLATCDATGPGPLKPGQILGEAWVKVRDPIYVEIVRIVAAGERPGRVAEAISRFFDSLEKY